jgi:hypothetical protein
MRIVATWSRWAAGAGVLALGFVAAVEAYVAWTRSERTIGSFAGFIAAFVVVEAAIVLTLLRSEEARLARELRTARTGTSIARGMAARRRQRAPFFARLFSTRLGEAALLLADGDRSAAVEAMAKGSILMQGGRLDRLREVVDADAERAAGAPADLERCVQRLRAMRPTGHRETDLYRLHVTVKALLELGDAEGALDLVQQLEASTPGDEEARVYEAWLRVWFDLDAPPEAPPETEEPADAPPRGAPRAGGPLDEGTLRLATLLARAQGAEKLVALLEVRIASVARDDGQ